MLGQHVHRRTGLSHGTKATANSQIDRRIRAGTAIVESGSTLVNGATRTSHFYRQAEDHFERAGQWVDGTLWTECEASISIERIDLQQVSNAKQWKLTFVYLPGQSSTERIGTPTRSSLLSAVARSLAVYQTRMSRSDTADRRTRTKVPSTMAKSVHGRSQCESSTKHRHDRSQRAMRSY